jgi:hypothetical protein
VALPAFVADYLFIGPLVEARLRQELGDQIDVRSVDELPQVVEGNLTRDTVFVVWMGERVVDEAGRGASTQIEQRWVVLVAIKSSSQQDAARTNKAGALLSQSHKAVCGWTPEGAGRAFTRASGIAPRYLPGKGLYPLTFSISLAL